MRRATAAGIVLLLATACRHPSKVGTPATSETGREQQGEPSRAEKGVPPSGARPRAPSSPKGLLAEGEISRIQDALAARGYLERHRTGALDDATTRAIRKFQVVEGLAETGFPDRLTLQKLGLDPEKSYGRVRERSGEGSAGSKGDGR